MIDAGSSGSRIQIYSWLHHQLAKSLRQADGESLSVLPRVEPGVPEGDEWQLKVTPGISTFGSSPEGIADYLAPLMDRALEVIPPDQVPHTPIFLLATAGMRLLPVEQQKSVLAETCSHLRSAYSFAIKDCRESIRIISGEEEGIFGWTAVNYLLEGFDLHSHSDSDNDSSTFGFLDMGGASAQIAFEPNTVERLKHDNDLEQVVLRHLDGRTLYHPVFVTTWLGYGTNQARDRYLEQLSSSRRNHERNTISDPCLPKDLLLATDEQSIMLKGAGDFTGCMNALVPLLNKDAPCPDQPCLFAGVHAPAIDFAVNHFIGISEYWYSTNEIFKLGGIYDFVEFERAAIEYCATSWDDILETRRSGTDLTRLQMQCFKAAWLVNILHEGIGIPRITDSGGKGDGKPLLQSALKEDDKGFAQNVNTDSKSNYFQSVDSVNNIAVSWTLGKIVLEVTASIPASDGTDSERAAWLQPLDFDLDQIRPSFDTLTKPHASFLLPLFIILCLFLFCFRRRLPSHLTSIFSRARRRRCESFDLEDLEGGESLASPQAKSRESNANFGALGGTFRRWSRRLSIAMGHSSSRSALPQHMNATGSFMGDPGASPQIFSMRPHSLRHVASSPALQTQSSNMESSNNGSSRRPGGKADLVLDVPHPARSTSRSPSPGLSEQVIGTTNSQHVEAGLERTVTPLNRFSRTSSRNASSTSLANGFYARRAKDTAYPDSYGDD